ncbi:unnamed protein product [Ceratitis capitata]|uniref:(Mediterranean fruit fly) hypothetical protein n=1 Tax=Ceratitis capitata TaxID=7213 RepID=A0A811VDD5_CERCA|nr:unnamed protein product [Ceratitis capitata]
MLLIRRVRPQCVFNCGHQFLKYFQLNTPKSIVFQTAGSNCTKKKCAHCLIASLIGRSLLFILYTYLCTFSGKPNPIFVIVLCGISMPPTRRQTDTLFFSVCCCCSFIVLHKKPTNILTHTKIHIRNSFVATVGSCSSV